MYKIPLPLLGFEEIKNLEIEKIDDYFSILILDKKDNITYTIVNISYLEHAAFDFNIDNKTLAALQIKKRSDIDIYFGVVFQEPIEKSIINLVAPIIINEKLNLIGQYVIKEKIPKLFINLLS